MPFLETGNGEIYYEDHGSGPTVVFAHGLGGNHAIWWRQIEYFTSFYRVITFDHQGFGLSQRGSGVTDLAPSDALAALLDELELAEVVLVGQSMGGYTCWGYAVSHAERVRALVMSASPGPLINRDEMDLRERQENLHRATADLTQPERVLAPMFRERHPAEVWLYTQISSFSETTQMRLAGARPPDSTAPDAGPDNVSAPTLFIAGGQDVLFPPDLVRDIARLTGASFIEIPLSGHSPFFECPDVYNFIVHSFFRANGWGQPLADSLFISKIVSAAASVPM